MAELDVENLKLNDIDVSIITNDDKTGIFDKLMDAVSENINTQFQENRITSSDYANVYLGSMQTVLTQSVQFALQEQISEAQVAGLIKDNAIKDEQLSTAYVDRVLKDKQIAKLGLDNVMKKSEEARADDPDFIYKPNYTKEIE